jgi:3-methyladenine DNA glycosylase AlkC
MAEPFKELLNPARITHAGQTLSQRARGLRLRFDAQRFSVLASEGLQTLEMKARAMHIADALEACLPTSFDDAATLIEASLARPQPVADGEAVIPAAAVDGLNGWICWPLGEYIARRGLGEPERALRALHALTQRFTAEWAIRPFIVAHPRLCFAQFAHWAQDESAHVRRLVSEGSRPRLPWGLQLKALVADPGPSLPLLKRLQDDPSAYVRRSVANHLNDIAKDHPELVADWLHEHLPGASAPRTALLRHAARGLIKAGHQRCLQAFGLGARFQGEVALKLSPPRLKLGQSLSLELRLNSTSKRPQPLEIDYAVLLVKANGSRSPKVFKGWKLELPAGQSRQLDKRHPIKPITTRRYHAGLHAVELRINGLGVASAEFHLLEGSA